LNNSAEAALRKSLAIIASALLLAVAAATHDRLRYDSSVFADAAVAGAERARQVEYPPCKKGVREDRCIQLYERGVKRSYQRWLASNGRGATPAAAAGPARTYRACRGRNDDRCQQRASTRQARGGRQARPVSRATAAQRRAATRRAAANRAQSRAATRATARQQRAAPAPRQRAATRASAPAPQRRSGSGTPGI
jgi:hypothetical protein